MHVYSMRGSISVNYQFPFLAVLVLVAILFAVIIPGSKLFNNQICDLFKIVMSLLHMQ